MSFSPQGQKSYEISGRQNLSNTVCRLVEQPTTTNHYPCCKTRLNLPWTPSNPFYFLFKYKIVKFQRQNLPWIRTVVTFHVQRKSKPCIEWQNSGTKCKLQDRWK